MHGTQLLNKLTLKLGRGTPHARLAWATWGGPSTIVGWLTEIGRRFQHKPSLRLNGWKRTFNLGPKQIEYVAKLKYRAQLLGSWLSCSKASGVQRVVDGWIGEGRCCIRRPLCVERYLRLWYSQSRGLAGLLLRNTCSPKWDCYRRSLAGWVPVVHSRV
jgi:hypothetical protein